MTATATTATTTAAAAESSGCALEVWDRSRFQGERDWMVLADGESADQSLLVTSRRVLGLTEAAHNMTALEETGMQNEAVAAFASLFKASSGTADPDNPDADYP